MSTLIEVYGWMIVLTLIYQLISPWENRFQQEYKDEELVSDSEMIICILLLSVLWPWFLICLILDFRNQ